MRDTLEKIFASAQLALEKDLEKTSLADVIDTVKARHNATKQKVV